ncbi:putative alanine aminotransferase 2 [Baffinella frigidus]|nr:putative alanine aminotransferase 2 [Cryptophyta sp. CCMP2293]
MPSKVLTLDTINDPVKTMEYAVRGTVPQAADKITEMIAKGDKTFPFEKVLYCNIGNPHSVGQKPITFYREVMSLVDNVALLEHPKALEFFKPDVLARAAELKANMGGGTGAYSHSQGVKFIRQDVAKFIEKRDGFPANPDDIFLTAGASTAIFRIFQTLIAKPTDAILIPIPQYPIYSAAVTLLSGEQLGYQMDEDKGWGLDMPELRRVMAAGRAKGLSPKALVIINPGNPVGNTLSWDDLVELVKFCQAESLVLLADEVYQENIYTEKPFHSLKKVVRSLGADFDDFELVSFHSTSKGMIGECGRRGGYMELCGIDHKVQAEIFKLSSANLCSNLNGQIMIDLMVRPPLQGDASYDSFTAEYDAIYQALKRKSQMVYAALNAVEGVSCQPLEGAMYAFPKIEISEKACGAATAKGMKPDTLYALELLEHTGICTVPGSGFGQKEGTWHVRLTFLPEETQLIKAMV